MYKVQQILSKLMQIPRIPLPKLHLYVLDHGIAEEIEEQLYPLIEV